MHEHMFWLLILFGTSQLQANFSVEYSFCSTARITHRMKINQNPFPFIFQKWLFIPCNSLHFDRLQHLGCKQAAANTCKNLPKTNPAACMQAVLAVSTWKKLTPAAFTSRSSQPTADPAPQSRDVALAPRARLILFYQQKKRPVWDSQATSAGELCAVCLLLFFFFFPSPFTRRKVCLLAAGSGRDRNAMHAQTAQYFLLLQPSAPGTAPAPELKPSVAQRRKRGGSRNASSFMASGFLTVNLCGVAGEMCQVGGCCSSAVRRSPWRRENTKSEGSVVSLQKAMFIL